MPQLLVSPAELKHISISAVTAATVSCLCAYTGLVSCQLYKPSEASLDLQPLLALPNLQDFTLQGAKFHNVPLDDHLTGLLVDHANVSCLPGCTESPGVQNLSLKSVAKIALPGIGLGGCSALTQLKLHTCSCIPSRPVLAEGVYARYFNATSFPESLSSLTVFVNDQNVCLGEFGVFPAITCLHLLYSWTCSLFEGDVVTLTRLQKLVIEPAGLAGHC